MNYEVNDQMAVLSQNHPGIYTQQVPEQGKDKPRGRRKKSKWEGSRGGLRKRKLNEEQVNVLELHFGNEHKLEAEKKERLAIELGLDPRQVAIWFQNRRARWKSKKMEEDYSKLKNQHETIVLQKCLLETEVLKLKEQLSEAEKEIQKLLERADVVSSNSPNTSFSMEPPFGGEFGMENVFYSPEIDLIHGLEWVNLI